MEEKNIYIHIYIEKMYIVICNISSYIVKSTNLVLQQTEANTLSDCTPRLVQTLIESMAAALSTLWVDKMFSLFFFGIILVVELQ